MNEDHPARRRILNFDDADDAYPRERLQDLYVQQSTSLMGGRVGVGTLAPRCHLDVDGFIRSRFGGDGLPRAS